MKQTIIVEIEIEDGGPNNQEVGVKVNGQLPPMENSGGLGDSQFYWPIYLGNGIDLRLTLTEF